MNAYTTEHILEALAWEFGGEWRTAATGRYKNECGHISTHFGPRWSHDTQFYQYEQNVTARMARALEITAPWVWKNWSFKLRAEDGTPIVLADVSPEHTDDKWLWSIAMGDGPNMDLFADSEEDAKRAARAAYLRWMKGGQA